MKPGTRIIRLTSGDVEELRALNSLLGLVFDDPETYASQPPSNLYLSRWLAKEHVMALVAVVDGSVVGGLIAYELEKCERERSEIYIYDLGIAESFRRQGIASSLISKLREIAVRKEASVIYVQADYGDAPAAALYEKHGVRKDVMHFEIAIPK